MLLVTHFKQTERLILVAEPRINYEWAQRGMKNVGAWILGRNIFGPVRGPWPDDTWKGWWGDEPPSHVPTFVLTHRPRKSAEMEGGTTFHFVTEGVHSALQRAKVAANGRDVRIGGGVATIQQYLRAKLIDQLHLAFRPILMGSGESLFEVCPSSTVIHTDNS